MARLTLKFKDKVLKEYQFKSDISIGRIAGNDIVIDNTAVSGKHATVEVIDNHFILKDQGSLNGIFVNEIKAKEHELKEGDKILIGKHILEFDFGTGGALIGSHEKDEQEFSGMTMFIDTKQYKEMLESKLPKEPSKTEPVVPEPEKPKGATVRAKIITESQSTGRPTEIMLEKNINIIGKKSDADIPIHGFLCGDVAAIIERRKEQFVIRHCGGFSKTKVNGETVQKIKLLSDGDEIRIGGNRLIFREIM